MRALVPPSVPRLSKLVASDALREGLTAVVFDRVPRYHVYQTERVFWLALWCRLVLSRFVGEPERSRRMQAKVESHCTHYR